MTSYGYYPGRAFGAPPPAAPTCKNADVPPITKFIEFTPTAKNMMCRNGVSGEPNPGAAIAKAVARAVEMMNNTIAELTNARAAVCRGEAPAWPVLGDITADWLKTRLGVCIEDMRVWTAGSFEPLRSVAEVIRRLVNIRNLIASNAMLYICNPKPCNPNFSGCGPFTWAFACLKPGCVKQPTAIRLCPRFWTPLGNPDHGEFQAQTIIHEAAHLYYCINHDRASSTIGGAECVSQFVAATNGSPIDCDFMGTCADTTKCGPIPERTNECSVTPALGAADPAGGMITIRTVIRPERAVRLKGRLAIRR